MSEEHNKFFDKSLKGISDISGNITPLEVEMFTVKKLREKIEGKLNNTILIKQTLNY